MTLPILYEDEYFLAINKPSGLLSVPGRGPDNQDCAIARVQTLLPNTRIIHRLDMATSGILLIAKDVESLRAFSRLFEQRKIQKRYIAIVHGLPAEDSGEIDFPLICDWPNRPKQKVCYQQGKHAKTHYQVLAHSTEQNSSRVALTPITGRSHQLRVHLLEIGHPILGDEFYGTEATRNAANRLLLHAEKLQFDHPITGNTVTIESPEEF